MKLSVLNDSLEGKGTQPWFGEWLFWLDKVWGGGGGSKGKMQ